MNPSTQPALEPNQLDPVYSFRDDLAQTLSPANSYERMLLTAVAQAWMRYQQAQLLERQVFEKTSAFELISNNLETFKAVTRHVTNCERAWRHAIEELKRAQRARAKSTLASPRPRTLQPVQSSVAPVPVAAPPGPPAAQPRPARPATPSPPR